MLLKYRLWDKAARPFVSAGAAFDTLTLKNSFVSTLLEPISTTTGSNSSSFGLQNTVVTGFSTGLGMELPAGKRRIGLEVRYTRWASPHFLALGLVNSKQNQLEFLLGFSF